MKRFLVIVVAMVLCTSAAFAQNKGDKYIGGYAGINLQSTFISSGKYNNISQKTYITSYGIKFEYAEFIANHVKLGVNLGYANTSNTYTYTVTIDGAYYIPICEKLYYTPGIELGAVFAQKNGTVITSGMNVEVNIYARGIGVTANIFTLEFKPTEHFGISASLVSLDYIWLTYTGNSSNTINFNFGINPTVGFKYYF